MNRCLLASLIAAPLLGIALPAAAQTAQTLPAITLPEGRVGTSATKAGNRTFPSNAEIGILRVDQIPHAQINKQAIRTAPGFRLFSPDNKLIFADTVKNKDLGVAYVIEANTKWLLTAWILTPEEMASHLKKR